MVFHHDRAWLDDDEEMVLPRRKRMIVHLIGGYALLRPVIFLYLSRTCTVAIKTTDFGVALCWCHALVVVGGGAARGTPVAHTVRLVLPGWGWC